MKVSRLGAHENSVVTSRFVPKIFPNLDVACISLRLQLVTVSYPQIKHADCHSAIPQRGQHCRAYRLTCIHRLPIFASCSTAGGRLIGGPPLCFRGEPTLYPKTVHQC